MMGDDYHVKPVETLQFLSNKPITFGVKKAVDEFAIQRGLSVDIRWMAQWSYRYTNAPPVNARNWVLVKPLP